MFCKLGPWCLSCIEGRATVKLELLRLSITEVRHLLVTFV